ncbi:hypothetical protein THASP1DRAFT_14565, partial [Thamnocephalis sphaerospora]
MRSSVAVAALASLCLFASVRISSTKAQGCASVRERREFRTFSEGERTTYINAIRQLQSGARPTAYDRYTQMHLQVAATAHGWPWFLSWHRAFLRDYESALQRVDGSIMLPYWDWSYDSQAPAFSPIWEPVWLGGNGRQSDRCVSDGPFSGWQPFYPQPHCLQRSWDAGNALSPFYSPEALNSLIQDAGQYDVFRQQLESVPHGQVHVAIGSDMSTMISPNDPVFFFHHAFIDKLWADWQAYSPSRANDYGG